MKRLLICAALLLCATVARAEEKMLFDFEDAGDLAKWSPLKLEDEKLPSAGEPEAKFEFSDQHATSGKHSLKITFDGGRFPAITTASPVEDWNSYAGFKADVTVERTCMVVFRVLNEKSSRGRAYNDGVSRWEKAARLEKGTSTVLAFTPKGAPYAKVVTFEIYMYNPKKGETIYVDNIRLSTERPEYETPFYDGRNEPGDTFKLLGADIEVRNVDELADRLKDQWVKPEDKSIEQVEADFRARFEELRKTRPKAVLAIFRDGQAGYDPAAPDKPFAGWEDAGTAAHAPMGLTMACFANHGKTERVEVWNRGRPCFMRIDLSSIPAGANVLAARFALVRYPGWGRNDWETKPTMFVMRPCNRDWKEYEVNVFEFADGQFWKRYAGVAVEGDDTDAVPVYYAHGPSGGQTSSWDFTELVKYWTDGKHSNRGFIMYSAGKYVDYLYVISREHRDAAKRPALMVVWEPKD